MKTVYLSLGSNVGDRETHLSRACESLNESGIRIIRSSAVYQTEPRDVVDQAWFLNQVVEAQTDLFPKQLLAQTQKIERALGRVPTRPKGPRTIDIDILLYGDTVVSTSGLE